MKLFVGGGWKNVYKLDYVDDFFCVYNEIYQLVMMLQEAIDFSVYFCCYCIGGKYVCIMFYELCNLYYLCYVVYFDVGEEMMKILEDYVLCFNQVLGYDFNIVELVICDGVFYVIDFCNLVLDVDLYLVGQANFDWVVEIVVSYVIEWVQVQVDGKDNLIWGIFMKGVVNGKKF